MVKQLAFDFVAPALPTLGNFMIGRNAELVQRLAELCLSRGSEGSIYIWGARGSGRTHLLRGALANLRERGSEVLYIADGMELRDGVISTIDAAAVDDVDRLTGVAQARVFNLYNRLRENGGILLAAGNAPPAELRLRADLVTRFGWGLVYHVHALTDAEKAQALAEYAAARGFSLPPEVTQHLLAQVQRDMRTLVAMVESLDRYSLETKRPVTLPLVREMLKSAEASAFIQENEM